MTTCDYCKKKFNIVKKHGGQNRRYCYECYPEGLSRKERQSLRFRLISNMANEIKLNRGCDRCGYNKNPYALEWHHHNNDKEKEPSHCLNRSIEAYIQETSKCILLCANCHREEHFKYNGM